MELQDYIRILHKNWVLITAVFVASVTLAFTLTEVTPPTYTTSAKVFVSTAGASSASELQQSNAFTVESGMKMVAGTARSMGIVVDGTPPWEAN